VFTVRLPSGTDT